MKFHEAVLVISAFGLVVSSDVAPPSLSESDLMRSLEAGHQYTERLAELEKELIANTIFSDRTSSVYRKGHEKRATPEALHIGRQALQLLETTRALKERGITPDESVNRRLGNFGAQNRTCLQVPICTYTKYRSIDGSCNSLKYPLLGKSSTTYRRLLPAKYGDGIYSLRLSSRNTFLKSPRLISSTVVGPTDRPSQLSLMAMHFGQFFTHNVANSPLPLLANGDFVACCTATGKFLPAGQAHPLCLPFQIPANDPFYSRVQTGPCMDFSRTVLGVRNDCSLGPADQINSVSHWLDGSAIYGSTPSVNRALRTFKSGRLLVSVSANRQLLPVTSKCANSACFIAGDDRVTQNPDLTIMHTIWLREHNRVANALASLHPTWNDETLYQEARRIVVAELQHITYTEWLPNILSPIHLESYNLVPSADFSKYKPTLTSGPISNEFTTAAFRMGHSMIQGFVRLFDQTGALSSTSYNLSDFFDDSSLLVKQTSFLDMSIRGLLTQESNAIDPFITTQVSQFLFRHGNSFGEDLVSLNIQRGRDHGLPSYNNYRNFCGLTPIKSFGDYPFPLSSLLARSYQSVDDIDLYIGGLTEPPVPGGPLGPTFSCLIAENFAQLKSNDRFFYDVGDQLHSFTHRQLKQIRKTSMARILCDNNDGTLLTVNRQAFLAVSPGNPQVPCDSIPRLNLNPWEKERV